MLFPLHRKSQNLLFLCITQQSPLETELMEKFQKLGCLAKIRDLIRLDCVVIQCQKARKLSSEKKKKQTLEGALSFHFQITVTVSKMCNSLTKYLNFKTIHCFCHSDTFRQT